MTESSMYVYLSYFMDGKTPLYGGSTGILTEPDREISKGDTANTKKLSLGNHSGTHIDFPNHFFENGKKSHEYDASFWIFAYPHVVELASNMDDIIMLSDELLSTVPLETDFLIIKTGFGIYRNDERYWQNNPGLHPDLADGIRRRCKGIRAVGIDIISITGYQNRPLGRLAHKAFLGENPILLVEDMDLSLLNSQPAEIYCFPIMVSELDGAPVTIVAKL
ncbi:MAG: cyclase family protein [Sphingobacteriaceae bacterium]|nr:cyclase family protein [Sphingobacteriaceae bacterium]